jgi:hypothetical protein
MMGTVAMITYYFAVGREKLLLKTMRQILIVFILVNIVTYFVFPNGLYVTELVAERAGKRNTFLGNRNSYKYYELLLIFITYMEGLFEEYKINTNLIFAFGIAIIGEMIGGSLTGAIIIAFVLIYYLIGEKRLKIQYINPRLFLYVAVASFIFIVGFVSLGKHTNIISYIFGGNITFSNRVRIWIAAVDIIKTKPILGIGTQSTTEIVGLIYNLHAHNQYLEIALRGGVIAVGIYLYSIWTTLNKARYSSVFLNVCLFAALIINLIEVETYSYAITSFFSAFIYNYCQLLYLK